MKRESIPVSVATVLIPVAIFEVSCGEFAATSNWVQPPLMTFLLMVNLLFTSQMYL